MFARGLAASLPGKMHTVLLFSHPNFIYTAHRYTPYTMNSTVEVEPTGESTVRCLHAVGQLRCREKCIPCFCFRIQISSTLHTDTPPSAGGQAACGLQIHHLPTRLLVTRAAGQEQPPLSGTRMVGACRTCICCVNALLSNRRLLLCRHGFCCLLSCSRSLSRNEIRPTFVSTTRIDGSVLLSTAFVETACLFALIPGQPLLTRARSDTSRDTNPLQVTRPKTSTGHA